ncbi:MAG: penicillin-binding transpeptidase domain-containing protein, partial [Alphaproteobacteria bacterium]
GKGKWKPANYSGQIYGPSPMRLGLEKSRNLMTVRLAQHIGIEKVIETARRFGVGENMRPELASALGAGEVTLLQLTSAYAMLANGGRKLTPTFIDSVQDRTGHIIFRHDDRVCPPCRGALADPALPPEQPDDRPLVAEPMTRYQIVSMMEGVVEHGTGRKVFMAGKPLAGKTGTTNDSFDAWFMGFSSNLAVGVYVGFDQPRTLGAREQGASVAAPIFQAFMEKAWDLKPGGPFKAPPGLEFARVSRTTGQPPEPGDDDVVLEGFLPGTRPETRGVVIGGGLAEDAPTPAPLPAAGAAATDDRAPAAPARPPQRRNLGRVY